VLNIDHSPPNSSPPQAEGGITKQAIAPIDTNTGGDITAVGTLRFGRGAVADLGQVVGGSITFRIRDRAERGARFEFGESGYGGTA